MIIQLTGYIQRMGNHLVLNPKFNEISHINNDHKIT